MEGLQEMESRRVINGKLGRLKKEAFYNKMKLVVVCIKGRNSENSVFSRTGLFVSNKGHVLTLDGDVLGGKESDILIETFDRKQHRCKIVARDRNLNLALLQISIEKITPYAKVYDKGVKIGDQVYAIGETHRFPSTFSIGEISHPRRDYDTVYDTTMKGLELDDDKQRESSWVYCVADIKKFNFLKLSLVQVNNIHGQGSLGMPIFNYRGHVIGLWFFFSNAQEFAVDAETIRNFLNTQREPGQSDLKTVFEVDPAGSSRGSDGQPKRKKKKKQQRS